MQITGVYVDGGSSNWIITSGTETKLTCTADSGRYLKLDPSRPKADWIMSAGLSAHLAKATVQVRTNDTGPLCGSVRRGREPRALRPLDRRG